MSDELDRLLSRFDAIDADADKLRAANERWAEFKRDEKLKAIVAAFNEEQANET